MKNEELRQLYEQQLVDFALAGKNYAELKKVLYRDITCNGFSIELQHNPARMISTNANVDPATLQSRPCFLCGAHKPHDQQGLNYGDRYHIFVNPYPIFDAHFTVPAIEHVPQLIDGRFEDLLNLAFDFPGNTVFYNGPDCGASAPDHFHFQMIPRHRIPLEQDVNNPELRRTVIQKDFYSVAYLQDYLREVIILQASDQKLLSELFNRTKIKIGETTPYDQEPMMNILTWFDNCQWCVCIFPRQQRRPWQFFAEDDSKILFSPGCVDMAGTIIAPRKKDFNRYSAELLTDLFRQVTITPESREFIIRNLQHQSL